MTDPTPITEAPATTARQPAPVDRKAQLANAMKQVARTGIEAASRINRDGPTAYTCGALGQASEAFREGAGIMMTAITLEGVRQKENQGIPTENPLKDIHRMEGMYASATADARGQCNRMAKEQAP